MTSENLTRTFVQLLYDVRNTTSARRLYDVLRVVDKTSQDVALAVLYDKATTSKLQSLRCLGEWRRNVVDMTPDRTFLQVQLPYDVKNTTSARRLYDVLRVVDKTSQDVALTVLYDEATTSKWQSLRCLSNVVQRWYDPGKSDDRICQQRYSDVRNRTLVRRSYDVLRVVDKTSHWRCFTTLQRRPNDKVYDVLVTSFDVVSTLVWPRKIWRSHMPATW